MKAMFFGHILIIQKKKTSEKFLPTKFLPFSSVPPESETPCASLMKNRNSKLQVHFPG